MYPCGKNHKKMNVRKGISAPQKVSEVFQKIIILKMRFLVRKYENFLMSKNDIKDVIRVFNQEL